MMLRLLITPGDPAGIGLDLALGIATMDTDVELVVVCDPELLKNRAQQLGQGVRLQTLSLDARPSPTDKGHIKVLPVKAAAPAVAGQPDPRNSGYVIDCLNLACDACLSGQADGLVTGPINKAIINDAQIAFTGHTEHLQQRCGVDQVVMMLATESLKVALVTTHLALREVPDAITRTRIDRIMALLLDGLKRDFGLMQPRILVAGLNPHAGENGYLGREELDIIGPALDAWRSKNETVIGPLPADTLFAAHQLVQGDAVLAMYHDQGLPVLKHTGFGQAVNITLGLPIIRTSVDHGTAYELAGKGLCDSGSFLQAIAFARTMAQTRKAQTSTSTPG